MISIRRTGDGFHPGLFINVLSEIKSDGCLDVFICNELARVGENSNSLEEVRTFLTGRMSGDIVFWEEKDIHEQILYWALDKKAIEETRRAEESRQAEEARRAEESRQARETDGTKKSGENTEEPSNDFKKDEQKELLNRAKEKLLSNKHNSEKMYSLLVKLLEEHKELAYLIDEIL